MATDRELLELAAKAAGLKFKWRDGDPKWGPEYAGPAAWLSGSWNVWNPLTDDGDALRLAGKLNITTGFDTLPDGAIVYTSAEWHDEWDKGFRIMEWLGKDASAATRRAIVRAAAEIGRSMLSTDKTR